MAPSKDPEVTISSDSRVPEPAADTPSMAVHPQTDAPNEMETKETNGQTTKRAKMAKEEQTADMVGGVKLSGAELKKRAKAEKAAKRAKEKAQEISVSTSKQQQAPGLTKKGSAMGKDISKSQQSSKGLSVSQGSSGTKSSKAHTRTPSSSMNLQRQRTRDKDQDSEFPGFPNLDDSRPEEKIVPLFGHLYGMPPRRHIRGAEKDVHPTVVALGLQMSDFVVTGANARCVAMLLAFKQVIRSYTTPPGTSLARHLTTHLGHQIDYIKSCRPLGTSMGNSIRWLKLEISKVDPSTPEDTAKAELCSMIDNFIRERITVADEVIAKAAAQKIQNGDVILTTNKSSIVQQTLLEAKKEGKTFRVYIIDSRPLEEGKYLATALKNAGIEVTYSFHHALGHAVREATKCFLGAHAMMSNGRLFSRCGTAMVALMAHEAGCPVIVCCESIKFSERVALDSIVHNEIASPDELVGTDASDSLTKMFAGMSIPAIAAGDTLPSTSITNAAGKGKPIEKGKPAAKPASLANMLSLDDNSADDDSDEEALTLEQWRDGDQGDLTMLNLMYDLTPAEYVDLVVCEYGNLPPTSVPVVHRMSSGQ